ncbi:MAG: biotin synthase BioB [Acidobacteriota bacterium]
MTADQNPSSAPWPRQSAGRTDWSAADIREIHQMPFPDLIYRAQTVHRAHHDPVRVQLCTLLSIKTGGCAEDCRYCPQSSRYETGVESGRLLDLAAVLAAAGRAREQGSTRFCMGAAWRSPPDGPQFQRILDMVRGVRDLGLEACCTLGMLTAAQAAELAGAGLTAYNHNLDTGPAFYQQIISTRRFDERLDTLQRVREAGITVCCGGIIGMGESLDDRVELLTVLAGFAPHPESVPINALVRVPGTPLAGQPPLDPLEMVRMVATARIVLPVSRVRLSAGRAQMSDETQALCFLAGANSIFTGDTLLTTENPGEEHDRRLLKKLGLSPAAA